MTQEKNLTKGEIYWKIFKIQKEKYLGRAENNRGNQKKNMNRH